ncbi:MAG: outer membrane beta-barrel protein [Pseudomonadota bacterium]
MRRSALSALALAAVLSPAAAQAEWELSVYLGYQTAPHSDVEGTISGAPFEEFVAWEGRSFENPIYYGFRATNWLNDTTGWGVELNHAKVYASDEDLADLGFTDLEFSDGLNFLTVNYMRRFPDQFSGAFAAFTPYVGAGAGLAIPHVDVSDGSSTTFEYQLTGPAVVWMAGASYPLTESFSGFVEYKGSFSSNTADLEGGGELRTDIITNALNFGVSYSF